MLNHNRSLDAALELLGVAARRWRGRRRSPAWGWKGRGSGAGSRALLLKKGEAIGALLDEELKVGKKARARIVLERELE